MIHGVFGKLGGGKGLYVMDIIARELMDGFRDVVTNVPVRVLPWVNGQGEPQIGLRSYLSEKLSPLSLDEVDEILKRVHCIEDSEQGADLFLWRRDGLTGEWFKMEITKKDEKGRAERFDPSVIQMRRAAPCLVVTDEAWNFYPNNGGWSRAPILNFYGRQQRKLRDEWYIVTQHPTDCDEVFWKIAQDFHVTRNYGMERMGIFQSPSMFRIQIYLTNPAKGNAIRSHEIYRRLDRRLCQCYDTTAGIGLAGGMKGDSGQRKKGVPLWVMGFGILAFVIFLMFVPRLMGRLASQFMSSAVHPTKSLSQLPAGPVPVTFVREQGRVNQPSMPTNTMSTPAVQVFCRGFLVHGASVTVFLSDGRTAQSDYGEVEWVTRSQVKVFGETYPVEPKYPDPYTAQPVATDTVPLVASGLPAPINQADVTVIGQSAQNRNASKPSLGAGSTARFSAAPTLPVIR